MSRPRKPGRATKGFRDRLASGLQAKGYKYETAWRGVGEVFDQMKQSLARRESVEIPGLGRLVVTPAKQKRCWRLGQIVDIPKYPFRIGLKLDPGRPRPERTAPRKRSHPAHPPPIAVAPHAHRSEVPTRTRGIKPGKR